MEFVLQEEWAKKIDNREQVSFLESYHWLAIRKELAGKLLEKQQNKGVLVKLDDEEFVFYYDQNVLFCLVPLKRRYVLL